VRAGAPPEPDRLNFGMVGIVKGQSLRLNVAHLGAPPDPDLPPGQTRVRLTFVAGGGNAFTDPRTGNPVQREVTLQPGHATFLQVSFKDIGDARPRRNLFSLSPWQVIFI
jgi:hypothetical protein